MDNRIEMSKKDLLKQLRILFLAAILDGVLFVVLGESDVIPNGLLAGDKNAEFIATTVAILLTLAAVWAGIKWMGGKLERRPSVASDEEALTSYRKWSMWRLLLWDVVMVADIVVYYLTISSTGILAAAIMLLAILVCCWPSEEKLAIYMGERDEEIEDIDEASQRESLPEELAEQVKGTTSPNPKKKEPKQ